MKKIIIYPTHRRLIGKKLAKTIPSLAKKGKYSIEETGENCGKTKKSYI